MLKALVVLQLGRVNACGFKVEVALFNVRESFLVTSIARTQIQSST